MAEVKCIKNHLQNFEKNSGIATGENRISITQNEQKKKQKHQKTYVLQLNWWRSSGRNAHKSAYEQMFEH